MSLSAATLRLAQGLLRGERRALAKAITLVESTRVDHRAEGSALVSYVTAEAARMRPTQTQTPSKVAADDDDDFVRRFALDSVRIGISGSPGVGKSTFIEAFGMYLVDRGHRVAVLAVDPSSARTGGSLLGDKTRMARLSAAERAYVRPSPTRGTLGGVTRSTGDAVALCEAAAYDVVLVETVGVGQSETAAERLVDAFVLVLAPHAGDELQSMKKGIMEMADVLLVNKCDGELRTAARRARTEAMRAMQLSRPKYAAWQPRAVCVSALDGTGLTEAWRTIGDFIGALGASEDGGDGGGGGGGGARRALDAKRRRQRLDGMRHILPDELAARFWQLPAVRAECARRRMTAPDAAAAAASASVGHACDELIRASELKL